MCVSAELPNEIDARRAKEAKERAEEEMRQHHSQMEYHHSQANLLAPWSVCVSSSAIPDNFSEYRSKGPVHTNRSFF
mgnify:CR=1 FL=1